MNESWLLPTSTPLLASPEVRPECEGTRGRLIDLNHKGITDGTAGRHVFIEIHRPLWKKRAVYQLKPMGGCGYAMG